MSLVLFFQHITQSSLQYGISAVVSLLTDLLHICPKTVGSGALGQVFKLHFLDKKKLSLLGKITSEPSHHIFGFATSKQKI